MPANQLRLANLVASEDHVHLFTIAFDATFRGKGDDAIDNAYAAIREAAKQTTDCRYKVGTLPLEYFANMNQGNTTRRFYFESNGKRTGPVNSEALRRLAASGQLAPTDLVWQEGIEHPVPAQKVKGLFSSARVAASPAFPTRPEKSPQSPVISTNMPTLPKTLLDYDYDAFISYRHTERDRKWAKWLHHALETYRTPAQLARRRRLPRRLKRVFRDEEELPASADLSTEIRRALIRSRFLVVICSRDTPDSLWVNQEIEQFRELGRHDKIVAILTDGEPRQAFPRALCEIRRSIVGAEAGYQERIEEVEPLAADVRPRKEESNIYLRRMAKLRVLACLLGVSFDDLRQRDTERRQRFFVGVALAISMLLTVFSLLTVELVRRGALARDWERRKQDADIAKLSAQNAQMTAEREAERQKRKQQEEQQRRVEADEKAAATEINLELQRKLTDLETERAAEKAREAQTEQSLRQWKQYIQEMQQIPTAWEKNDIRKIKELLDNQAPETRPGVEDLRGIEWYYWRYVWDWSHRIPGIGSNIAISRDGRYVATATHEVSVWDTRTCERVWKGGFDHPFRQAYWSISSERSICFSPDGNYVAATAVFSSENLEQSRSPKAAIGIVRVWDTLSGDMCFTVKDPQIGYSAITFDPTSTNVVVTGTPWKSWNVKTKELGVTPKVVTSDEASNELMFSNVRRPRGLFFLDSARLLDGRGSMWSWPDGGLIHQGQAGSDRLRRNESVLPGNSRVSAGRGFRLFENNNGRLEVDDPLPATQGRYRAITATGVTCVDGLDGYVAAGGHDGIIRVWEPLQEIGSIQPEPQEYRGASGSLRRVCITRDYLGGITNTGKVHIWKRDYSDTTLHLPVTQGRSGNRDGFTFVHGDLEAKYSSDQKTYVITRVSDQKVVSRIPMPKLFDLKAFSRSGRFVAFHSSVWKNSKTHFSTRIWDIEKNRETAVVEGGMNLDGVSGEFSSNEEFLAVLEPERGAKVVRCVTGEIIATFDEPKASSVCMSPTGKRISVGCSDYLVVYDILTKKRILHTELGARPKCFDATESKLVAVVPRANAHVGPAVVIDIESDKLQRLPIGVEDAKDMLYAPDGRRLYIAHQGQLVVCSADDGSLLAKIRCEGIPDLSKIGEANEILEALGSP